MFSINYKDSRPIYEQVKDNLRRAIITGLVKPDEKIPSVRDLAGQLTINPNTIQKAYRELETEGYIYSVAGKGSFVGDYAPAIEVRRRELFSALEATVSELLHLNLTAEDVCAHIREFTGKELRS